MENLTEIESLYKHLEDKALDYKYPHQIGNLFKNIRDLKSKENKSNVANKSQWELDFFNFVLINGEIKPRFVGTNNKGEEVEYPSFERFDDKTYQYLIKRLNSTKNALLKARYANIIWCSPKKHQKYAKIAVDSYLELVKIYEKKDKILPKEHFGSDVLQAIQNAYYLAYQINYKKDEIKQEIRRLVLKFNPKSDYSFALRFNLITLMLNGKKRFNNDDFKDFEKICWQFSNDLIRKRDFHQAIQIFELGEIVEQKLKNITYCWRKKIAECYEDLMKQAEKNNDLASENFCRNAIDSYRKTKDFKKVKELERKYSELKSKLKYQVIRTPIDLTKTIKKCKKIAKNIVQNSSEEIISILMHHKDILPKYKEIEKIAEEQMERFITLALIPTVIMDQSGHPAQHFDEDDEKKYYAMLQQYKMELEKEKIHLIREIFFSSIQKEKLSSKILLKFLKTNSWFGKTIEKKLSSNNIIKYNWLYLIAPAIHDYFYQMQYYLQKAIEYPNLILSIDSLILKMEGLFRDFCTFNNIATFRFTVDNKGRPIVREKAIYDLLYENQIKEKFDEDELLFFKFLLVEKAGYNLRNKVAHSLMIFQEYNIDLMHLLILGLLKIGKYNFAREESSPNNKK